MNPSTTTEPETDVPFSAALRAVTWDDHERAESSEFMQAIILGTATQQDYAELVAQHYFAYVEIERATEIMRDDPIAGPFTFPELTRLPSIEQDLAFLVGDDWKTTIAPTEATVAYCDRLREVATWPGGFVAHHYTRYLGDLSGGQFIGRAVEKLYGFEDHLGARFYRFDQITDPKSFKDQYRDLLDQAPWPADEQARIIEEIRLAYRLNTRVLNEMPLQGS